jgi:hypothetical protein
MPERKQEPPASGLRSPATAALHGDPRLATLQQFIEALAVIAQARLADRRACAHRTVEALYRFLRVLHANDALEATADLRDAFADLEQGRRPELFEPARIGPGRRTSVREHRLKAWAIAAAEALEARGLGTQQANRKVAEVVQKYGMEIGRQDTRSSELVVAGWRHNLRRAKRTPAKILSFLPGIRRVLQGCEDRQEILSLLAHVGFEDAQFAPILGRDAARIEVDYPVDSQGRSSTNLWDVY